MDITGAPCVEIFLAQLQRLVEGLFFLSESEYPLEVVHYPGPGEEQAIAALPFPLGPLPVDTKVEVVDLPYFFRNHTNPELMDEETVQRFRQLQNYLEQQLQMVVVYRIGEREIQAYVVGKIDNETYAGVKTTLIET